MTRDEIEAIAQRPTCCKAWDETVSLTKAERDALVEVARAWVAAHPDTSEKEQ